MSDRSNSSSKVETSAEGSGKVKSPDLSVFNQDDLEENGTELITEEDLEEPDQESEEEDNLEEPEEPLITNQQEQWHVLVTRPDGFPLCESFDNPNTAARYAITQTRKAVKLGELAAWRIFVFFGIRSQLFGDPSAGELYIKHGDDYYSAAPQGDENLPPPLAEGQLIPRPQDASPGSMSGSSGGQDEFLDSDMGW